ncbi:Kelch-like protein 10 [Elasticomyces elasticus]|nr:Kelch-like protein 10 [Elasticomyces elasticus]
MIFEYPPPVYSSSSSSSRTQSITNEPVPKLKGPLEVSTSPMDHNLIEPAESSKSRHRRPSLKTMLRRRRHEMSNSHTHNDDRDYREFFEILSEALAPRPISPTIHFDLHFHDYDHRSDLYRESRRRPRQEDLQYLIEELLDIAADQSSSPRSPNFSSSSASRHNDSTALLEQIASLRLDSKYADLTLISAVEGRYEFRVHRAIVCRRSSWIAAAVNGKFLEATKGEITDRMSEVKSIARMLDWIYRANYGIPVVLPNATESLKASTNDPAADNGRTSGFNRQERFAWSEPDTPRLTTTDRMIERQLLTSFGSAAEDGEMMDRDGFAEVVRAVYTLMPSASKTLRQAVVEIACERIQYLLAGEQDFLTVERGDSASIAAEFPEFLADLIRVLSRQMEQDAWNAAKN